MEELLGLCRGLETGINLLLSFTLATLQPQEKSQSKDILKSLQVLAVCWNYSSTWLYPEMWFNKDNIEGYKLAGNFVVSTWVYNSQTKLFLSSYQSSSSGSVAEVSTYTYSGDNAT